MRRAFRPNVPELVGRLAATDRGVPGSTLEHVLMLALEIAREGREGRKIGTLFVVGDTEAVLARSRCLILDPLAGHPEERRHIASPDVRETLKELAQLDGGFVVREDGVVVSAARYFDTDFRGIDLPLGLGARHLAGASITRNTNAVAVVVSESALVRLFDDGELVGELLPELWMIHHYGFQLLGDDIERLTQGELTMVRRTESS